ncbi:undecaprenyldiphospho-muramoylpentapeptide beta-N- acetylglucosaminyltransferase [Edaphobacter acidisoli]|uniref:UDP-N-acetylglucosamine--N-acetylmuramyl-(pentapeptide) pyrophosphoryl-undecaprenol N-acetylglucosamine transferase n=1 Tax=Edaphobacter acidisoli TaxID=2040573 RepID=A0A916W4V1_9BACT|nr:undecaprenyldiphospho-muramoylpentapeptide beta-N-acetylglucosaminyltransferase [Edaphobacter acidisoli]GGA65642.1 undecaprenyldiphospho-muramoylpentapeptide beta-N- acetylglucosaminyltransferase [Edaphobacter acidisoli]
MRVLIAGGGTGGHVVPALAIARELRDSAGAEVRFVGTARGLETRLVPEAGFPLELIRVGQLKNVSAVTRVRTLADLPLGVLRCVGLLRRFRPDVVVGVGGYASGPAMMAAVLLGVPTLAFEPNAVPGLANRMVGRMVSAAAVNFEESRRYFRNAQVTGTPVRPEFFGIAPKEAGGRRRLLVFGASQGARVFNELVPRIAERLLGEFPDLDVVHQTGARHGESTAEAYRAVGGPFERVRVTPYLDDMAGEFAAADLVVCRSGASTMAELAAAGRAAVLVPFPQAADDHQRKNAYAFVARGAAEMVVERELTEERLLGVLRGLLGDDARRAAMGEAARGLAHPDALGRIAGMVRELAR